MERKHLGRMLLALSVLYIIVLAKMKPYLHAEQIIYAMAVYSVILAAIIAFSGKYK